MTAKLGNTITKRKMLRRKCRCVTRWLVDFGDERGVQPVPAICAALASGIGLTVSLGQFSTTPFRPIGIPGLQYSGCDEVEEKFCKTCGWPTRVTKVNR